MHPARDNKNKSINKYGQTKWCRFTCPKTNFDTTVNEFDYGHSLNINENWNNFKISHLGRKEVRGQEQSDLNIRMLKLF